MRSMSKQPDAIFDYIVIGAGSAGCVIASRLTENHKARVLLIEAGGRDNRLSIKMPSAFYMPLHDKKINWGYYSEPEPGLDHRRIHCPRGKVLGGSSSINGMVYIRGNRKDFDNWERLGATGWNYDSVLPYFKKSQKADLLTQSDTYKGHDGPLATTTGAMGNPLYTAFLEATQAAGFPLNEDVNGKHQEGFGPMPMTVDQGIRASSYHSFISNAKRSNLKISTTSHVNKLLIKDGVATGVNYTQKNRQINATATKEIILCAGAINSPQILMLSGIGPANDLKALGIHVQCDLPGVGQNLMDHLEVYVQQASQLPISLHSQLGWLGKGLIGIKWLATRRGLGATNHFEAGGFVKSDSALEYPDIQFHFLPVAMSYDGKVKASQHGFQVHVGPMLSKSRGTIKLASSNPKDQPKIQFNYMSHEEDFIVFRKAIRTARSIFQQAPFDGIRGKELNPGSHRQSDDELDAFVKSNAESAYHPCGTCKMGIDNDSVVDPHARVKGIEKLRVADASIFPQITNGNLNAPTIMVAERIADLIKSEQDQV